MTLCFFITCAKKRQGLMCIKLFRKMLTTIGNQGVFQKQNHQYCVSILIDVLFLNPCEQSMILIFQTHKYTSQFHLCAHYFDFLGNLKLGKCNHCTWCFAVSVLVVLRGYFEAYCPMCSFGEFYTVHSANNKESLIIIKINNNIFTLFLYIKHFT